MVTDFVSSDNKLGQLCNVIEITSLWEIENKRIYDLEAFELVQLNYHTRVKADLSSTFENIKSILQSMFEVFRNDGREVYSHWIKYVASIDSRIENAARTAVKKSLHEISKAINGENKTRDSTGEIHPLFKINLVLEGQKVDFSPSFASLENLVGKIAHDMISTVSVIPRLASILAPDPGIKLLHDLYQSISAEDDINKICSNIIAGVKNNAIKCKSSVQNWDAYREIWEINKDAFIRRYAKLKPPISTFDADINRYNEVSNNTQMELSSMDINFVRLDSSSLKTSLMAQCTAWQGKLTTLLNTNAANELYTLHEMFDSKSKRLQIIPLDLDGLGDMIALLTQLQGDLSAIEAQFNPIREMYEILEKYEVPVKDEEKEKLAKIPVAWDEFKQVISVAEKNLQDRKMKFQSDLLQSVDDFTRTTATLRNDLSSKGPFLASFGVPEALRVISEFKLLLSTAAIQERTLRKGLTVFRIEPAITKDLEIMATDLDMLSQLWIATQEWNCLYDSWRIKPFLSLDESEIDDQIQKFNRKLAKMGKEDMKDWEVFNHLKDKVALTKRILPLIIDLRNGSMRNRHWNQVEELIGKVFNPTHLEFNLEKIIELGLDQHAEPIAGISLRATKELSLEQGLKMIEIAWEKQEFDISVYKEERGYYQLRSTDALFELLEDNQVTLSTMKASKLFPAFESQIDIWEHHLSLIVEVVDLLSLVQKQWMYLENIFIGTEDIRKQLPKESSTFDEVDKKWSDIIRQIIRNPNALLACYAPNLIERLSEMNIQLEKIQKSLDMYLETKRQCFARFYFLSNDDLLEILGNAKNPSAIQPHLKKCFDNIHRLELTVGGFEGGQKRNEAIGMHSADGEYVPFAASVILEGMKKF